MDNITFMIKRIKIHTSNALKDTNYRFHGNYGVEKFLELFSGSLLFALNTNFFSIHLKNITYRFSSTQYAIRQTHNFHCKIINNNFLLSLFSLLLAHFLNIIRGRL